MLWGRFVDFLRKKMGLVFFINKAIKFLIIDFEVDEVIHFTNFTSFLL